MVLLSSPSLPCFVVFYLMKPGWNYVMLMYAHGSYFVSGTPPCRNGVLCCTCIVQCTKTLMGSKKQLWQVRLCNHKKPCQQFTAAAVDPLLKNARSKTIDFNLGGDSLPETFAISHAWISCRYIHRMLWLNCGTTESVSDSPAPLLLSKWRTMPPGICDMHILVVAAGLIHVSWVMCIGGGLGVFTQTSFPCLIPYDSIRSECGSLCTTETTPWTH